MARNSIKTGLNIYYVIVMKYLVVKGCVGFGDRLESLKMCVKFAMENNLQIYVDWTDPAWSHGSESFYSYFKLVGVSQLNSLDEIPPGASCYPPIWNGRIGESMTQEINNRQGVLYDTGPLTKAILRNNADVLVVTSIGAREVYPDSSFFAKVFRVVHPKIIEEVRRRKATLNLKSALGVHIRGTDRITLKKGRHMPIQSLALSAFTKGALSGKPMVAVSDDNASYEIWKRYFPQTVLLESLASKERLTQGSHNIAKENLNVSKKDMNVDSLIDFFTLSSCDTIISTYRDSRFFQEAVRLAPFVDTILSS